jgi:hypothetical protein
MLRLLIPGDILAILIVTLVGFLTHYQGVAGWRWLSSFLPIVLAWFAVAPWLGVYHADHSRRAGALWRPVLAALLSAPLAAVLRALWLNSAIPPVFPVVLAATNALGFLIWRGLWVAIAQGLERGQPAQTRGPVDG